MVQQTEKISDFSSDLWSFIKYDNVLRDLLDYYNTYYHQTATPDFTKPKQDAHNNKHASYPSNCFSYATDLLAKGNTPADPFYLDDLDFSNTQKQISIVSNKDYYKRFTPAIASHSQFKQAMQRRGIKSISDLSAENCKNYSPIIGLIARNDYHFVKVDFCNLENETRIILSHRMTKIRPSCQTLQEYADGYNEFYGAHYHHPQLLFSPKKYSDRTIEINSIQNDCFEVNLYACELEKNQ